MPITSADIYSVRFHYVNVPSGHWCYHALGITKFFPFPSA